MKFACDIMLGKLAKYLRFLGFDTWYVRNESDFERLPPELSDRIFLTRRKTPLKHNYILIKSEHAREQLNELKAILKPGIRRNDMLGRCVECNEELMPIDKSDVEFLVPEFVFHQYEQFKICPRCRRVYWEGSHTKGINQLIEEILR